MSAAMFATTPTTTTTTNNNYSAADARNAHSLEMHQYSQWREWAMVSQSRRSQKDLMSDIVDAKEERHMYIPSQSMLHKPPPTSADLGDDEMVARVVQFFQSVHNNYFLHQLQREDDQTNQFCGFPPLHVPATTAQNDTNSYYASTTRNTACHENSNNNENNIAMPELRVSPSVLAEQEALWHRVKEEQYYQKKAAPPAASPEIPDWLHHIARQQGRRIRVVTVDSTTDTRAVTCIGCKKEMIAASNVQIVFCPQCGCTFSPEMLAGE